MMIDEAQLAWRLWIKVTCECKTASLYWQGGRCGNDVREIELKGEECAEITP